MRRLVLNLGIAYSTVGFDFGKKLLGFDLEDHPAANSASVGLNGEEFEAGAPVNY